MNIKRGLLFISIICSLIFIGLSVQMINGRVEYGSTFALRIDETMNSKPEWYRLNEIAGWAVLISSGVMLIGSSLLYGFGRKISKGRYLGIFAIILFTSAVLAAAITSNLA